MLRITGKTETGTLVISGVFRFFETTGIPLDSLFDCFKQRNMIPDWISFYLEAVEAGMKRDRILSKLEPAIIDSYGPEFANKIIDILSIMTADTHV